MDYPVVEHGSSRPGRWLRAHRLQLALAIALAEAVLVVVGPLSTWSALGIALVVLLAYAFAGRNLRSDVARQLAVVAALSQALVAVVPLLVLVVGVVALVALGLLLLVAVVALLARRR